LTSFIIININLYSQFNTWSAFFSHFNRKPPQNPFSYSQRRTNIGTGKEEQTLTQKNVDGQTVEHTSV
jgi:hypothetical protein